VFTIKVLLKGREPSKIGVRMREDVHSFLILIIHGRSGILWCWLSVDVCKEAFIMSKCGIITLIIVFDSYLNGLHLIDECSQN